MRCRLLKRWIWQQFFGKTPFAGAFGNRNDIKVTRVELNEANNENILRSMTLIIKVRGDSLLFPLTPKIRQKLTVSLVCRAASNASKHDGSIQHQFSHHKTCRWWSRNIGNCLVFICFPSKTIATLKVGCISANHPLSDMGVPENEPKKMRKLVLKNDSNPW